ncbi:PREDICTED: oocyte-secreted protein 2 [Chrysochloris asiatica]|uniref:Oocyte-secreted protein 2 n=1 Tax=Chrysochloris asiatica TaxID=185453 RepID=A0A9B0X056_CHRAS|nr:PREDICTED: oocyte-secreted protein 2 [Chrysochloris asiatica]
MKVSVVLEAWILLATSVWTCIENIHVQVTCSMDWLMVTVNPSARNSDRYIFADELFLGMGCPATRIQPYAYDFVYHVNNCGIRTKVISRDALLFQTEMYFIPRNMHDDSQRIPLECLTSSKSVWLSSVSTDNEIKEIPSPFIADFKTTSEEIGLLSFNQNGSVLRRHGNLECLL